MLCILIIICIYRSAGAVDQQDSRPVQKPQTEQRQYDDPDEEPSQYRGYTNPKVQSRSFKILQESLSYTEANEEGIILPSGHTPGEGVVLRAYNEGRRRKEELAEISPGMFVKESPLYERGQNLLKCSEEDEEIIAKLKCSWKSKEPGVAKAKSYTPGAASSKPQEAQSSQGVDLSGSSVLAPAAAQKQYLEQAHAYYGDQNAPTIQVAVQQQPVQATLQQPIQVQPQPAPPRRRERKRQPKEQQAVVQKIQSPVSVPQASGFIPTTDTVSSVAVELNLKHESTAEQAKIQEGPSQAETVQVSVQSVQKVPVTTKPAEKQQVQIENVVKAPSVEKAEPKPSPKPEEPPKVQSEEKQIVQTETVIVTTPESSVTEVKNVAATVDASVEPTGDVIREYGERMAETVISESLQDASTGIRDVTDGSSVSKSESKQEQIDVATVEVVQVVAETPEPVQQQEPEPIVAAGKSEPEPKIEASEPEPEPKLNIAETSNQSTIVLEEKPGENVVQVDTSQNEVVVETVAVSDDITIDDTTVSVNVGEVSKDDEEATVTVAMEETTEVQAVIETPDANATTISLEASSADIVVDDINVSENVITEENVQVSIGEADASFVIGGGEEESSFVVSVQEEGSQDVTAEVQSETFDISITEDTEETANITLDLSADVTIDADVPTADDKTEVSLSLESSEATETVIVQEPEQVQETKEPEQVQENNKPEPKEESKSKKPEQKDEPKKEATKAEEPAKSKTENKTDSTKTDNAPPKKAKFVDSQGGVSARLARFNLKKK